MIKLCKYCGAPIKDPSPGQIYCNSEHYRLFKENGSIKRIDPIVDILSRINIPDEIILEMDGSTKDFERYKKFYKSTDLFILRMILINLEEWEPEPDNQNYVAFRNLLKWFIYQIAIDPWWHRKLCYYNRMMGVNTGKDSYWHLQFHPYYIPGKQWNDNLNMTPEEFNKEQMTQQEIYRWIDKEIEEHQ